MRKQWKKSGKKMFVAGLAGMVALSVAPQIPVMASISSTDLVGLKEGTYKGSAKVYQYNYDITTEVTIAAGTIADIVITDESYTNSEPSQSYSYLDWAANGIKRKKTAGVVDQILKKQSTENIDAVSNATYSSQAIVAAVENAVKEAKKATDLEKGEKENPDGKDKPETLNPGEDSTKPGEDSTKPGEDGTKPGEDSTKPGEDNTKPDGEPEKPEDSPEVNKDRYALMNIPFADFYANEASAEAEVLPVSSATKQKTKSTGLAAGSYHVDAGGSDISGIVYPVKLPADLDLSKLTQVTDANSVTITTSLRGQQTTTTLTGKDALFESPNYSYYLLSEVPAYYKEVSIQGDKLSFAKTTAPVQTVNGVKSSFKTRSHYGDYQLNIIDQGFFDSTQIVYGVVVNTKDGKGYGMRHVENIWRKSELGWGAGFTKMAHGSPIADSPYSAMMGKTISSVTYYTEDGVFDLDIDDVYVAVKTGASAKVENAKAGSGSTRFEIKDLPADFVAVYEVAGLDAKIENNTIQYTNAELGAYELEVSDKNKKYDSILASFVLEGDNPAEYKQEKQALSAKEGFKQEDLEKYIKAISKVKVAEKTYGAAGRGAIQIVKADGSIDLASKPFADNKESYDITIMAVGYPDLTFTLRSVKNQASYTLVKSQSPTDGSVILENLTGNTASEDGSLLFAFDAPFAEYRSIKLEKEGKGFLTLADTDYTVTEGSTVVTLKPAFVSTLSDGTYTLTTEFVNGQSVGVKFTVAKKVNEEQKEKIPSPNTNPDNGNDKSGNSPNHPDSKLGKTDTKDGGKTVEPKTGDTAKNTGINKGKTVLEAGNKTAKNSGADKANKTSSTKAAKTGDEGPFAVLALLGISFVGFVSGLKRRLLR